MGRFCQGHSLEASRPDAIWYALVSKEPVVEQLDHARMLPGVGGCETTLSTPLSKKFGKSVVGELTAAVRLRPQTLDTHNAPTRSLEPSSDYLMGT
jgi:hypothetical protein